jgi:hypothetical protein
MCPHGLPERHGAAASKMTELLIAPSGLAHFPGCPHKGDHGDYSGWGKLETPNAWQRLGNGESLKATRGFRLDRIATGRCQDCVSHGPW